MWLQTCGEYLHQCLEWYSKYGSSCLALARKMVTTCVWLASQCMERYSENLQVNSSFINWVYYNQGNSKQHLQIWQVISIQEACYDVGDLNVRRGYTRWKQRELGTLFHCQATFKSKNLTEQIFRILSQFNIYFFERFRSVRFLVIRNWKVIPRHVIYCDHYPDGAVEAGSNARERKPATVSHEFAAGWLVCQKSCFIRFCQTVSIVFNISERLHRMSQKVYKVNQPLLKIVETNQ